MKIDENFPLEFAELLQAAGYDASTVIAQELSGEHDRLIIDRLPQAVLR